MKERMKLLLLITGVLLFLAGLLNAIAIPYFPVRKMGSVAHVAGVQNGMVLLIFGLLWKAVQLGKWGLKIAYWLSIYSLYALWFSLLLIAIWGKDLSATQKFIFKLIFHTGSAAIIIAAGMILYGLYKEWRVLGLKQREE